MLNYVYQLSTHVRFIVIIKLVIIEKDLKRLPHPTDSKQPYGAISPPDNSPEQEARITSLREVLYIYAQEHPSMGYRQGMHEIASYVMFLLELEHQQYPDHPLFNPILPVCFALLERILDQLKTAYDASGGKSLQQMSVAILGKILQNDPQLYNHLTTNPNIPPPPIYCTRWVRLMFSREVVGYENVFRLWDVMFSYVNVMHALEITSACRILLLRDALLLPDSNTLDLLMNVPPLADITQLTDTLHQLMKQKERDQAIHLSASVQNLVAAARNSIAAASPSISVQHQLQQSSMYPQISAPAPAGQFHHPLEQPASGDSKFSFSKMRQSIGQKGESLRRKIITTTNEWKEVAGKRDISGGSFTFSGPSQSFDPLGGLVAHDLNGQYNESSMQGPSQSVSPSDARTLYQQQQLPKSPRQHQHEMWSKLLQQKIWTVQEFLIALESKENKGTVPREVWEALADMDQMHRELLNYSRSMAGTPY
jgi:TBC1 domain family protein 5